MSGIKDYEQFLENNTPFSIRYELHKDISIPILKDNTPSDCKETGKQLLQNTKRPLCQNLDVIIPERERSTASKHDVDYFKNFIGKRMSRDEPKTNKSNEHKTPECDTKKETKTPSSDLAKKFNECIENETNHVQRLQAIVTHITQPIRKTFNTDSPMLDIFLFNSIYLNVDTIYPVNKAFLEELLKYKQGETTESLGSIFKRFMSKMNIYRSFLLKYDDSGHYNTNAKRDHPAYREFVLNNKIFLNGTLHDTLFPVIQHLNRYTIILQGLMNSTDPQDPDFVNFQDAFNTAHDICNMRYGSNSKDSQLMYLFTLIKNLPCRFLNDKRKLLGYYDCMELSVSEGKPKRPVTILVFTDKIMVVKRSGYEIKSKEIFESIEKQIDENPGLSSQPSLKKNETKFTNNYFKKIVGYYSGSSSSLEIKGWVDIKSTEIFDGLKDRPDTFLLRTSIPDSPDDDPEAQYEDYFRRSDRVFSVIPTKAGYLSDKEQEYKAQREKIISLYQQQFALLNFTDESEVFQESSFSLPAYAYIYNENSYKKSNLKNNILAVYIEDDYKIDFNDILTEDVWALFLIHKKGKGFNIVVRSRVSMIPQRDPRETKFETIIDSNQNDNGEYDFFQTLWNSAIYYERRLRASNEYAKDHDSRLRTRSRSRSRSRSLSRSASRLFANVRSRSNSPSRPGALYGNNEYPTISTTNTSTFNSSATFNNTNGPNLYNPASNDIYVSDPVLKIASMNKKPSDYFVPDEISMQNQYYHQHQQNKNPTDPKSNFAAALASASINCGDNSNMGIYSTRGSVPPTSAYFNHDSFNSHSMYQYGHNRPDLSDFNSLDNNQGDFIDGFNDSVNNKRRPEDSMYGGCNTYQDNTRQNHSYSRTSNSPVYGSVSSANRPSYINTSSVNNRQALFDIESSYCHNSIEPHSRPSSGGGNSSSSTTSGSPTSISTSTNGMTMYGNVNNIPPNSRGVEDYELPDYIDSYPKNNYNEELFLSSIPKNKVPRKVPNRNMSSNSIPSSMMQPPYQQREMNRPSIPQFNAPYIGQPNARVDQLTQFRHELNSKIDYIIQQEMISRNEPGCNPASDEICELFSHVINRLDSLSNGQRPRYR